jgi:hypothetical protein
MIVPDHVQIALEAAGTKAAEFGTELARRLMDEARGRAQGIYVVAPFRRPEAALDLFL